MRFSIEFNSAKPVCEPGEAQGVIELGAFSETFCASLSYWDRDRYQKQWRTAIAKLLEGACTRVALVTAMYDPTSANFIIWWPMYRENRQIYVYNQVLFLEDLDRPFDEMNLLENVPRRSDLVAGDEAPSEWVVDLSAVDAFARKQAPGRGPHPQ